MGSYNKQKPSHRAQLNQYLTQGGPTKVGSELRQNMRLENLPNYNPDNDPNLLRRIKYLTKTYDNNDLGTQFDKAIDQEDKELAKLGRTPKNILQREHPKQEKPFVKYKRGEAKIIIDELKRQKRKANPILNTDLKIKLDTVPVYIPTPPVEDPETKRLRLKVEENERKNKQQKLKIKYSGLGAFDNRFSDE